MNESFGTCAAGDLPALLSALDHCFVTGRGRQGSLAAHYPSLFTAQNLPNIHVVRRGKRILSCCIVRPFEWEFDQQRWHGAMVGMVYTDPAQRGQGHARHVLTAAIDMLAARQYDFAVLWSALEGFYEAMGWERHDRGIFGSMSLASGTKRLLGTEPAVEACEAIRLRAGGAPRVVRDNAAYAHVPLHVEKLVRVGAGENRPGGYALIGCAGSTRYVYEMVGDAAAMPDLWARLSAGAQRVVVNDMIGSPSHRWLTQHTPIRFEDQQLAYWRMLSPRARRAPWQTWHVPFFDRI